MEATCRTIPPAACGHQRHGPGREVDERLDVDPDAVQFASAVDALNPPYRAQAGAVDQPADREALLGDRGQETVPVARQGRVSHGRVHPRGCAQRRGQLGQAVATAGDQGYRTAPAGQLAGERRADPGRRAGDDDGLGVVDLG